MKRFHRKCFQLPPTQKTNGMGVCLSLSTYVSVSLQLGRVGASVVVRGRLCVGDKTLFCFFFLPPVVTHCHMESFVEDVVLTRRASDTRERSKKCGKVANERHPMMLSKELQSDVTFFLTVIVTQNRSDHVQKVPVY